MAFRYLNADIHYFVAQSSNYFAGVLDLLQNSGETFIPIIQEKKPTAAAIYNQNGSFQPLFLASGDSSPTE